METQSVISESLENQVDSATSTLRHHHHLTEQPHGPGDYPTWHVQHGWRRLVLNFSPAWFAVVMGTGIVSLLPQTIPFPYGSQDGGTRSALPAWIEWISIAVYVLNILLFIAILAVTVLRYVMFPKSWSLMINHPIQSLYLGTAPMALSTIVSMSAVVIVSKYHWGGPSGWGEMFVWALWWINAAAAVAVALGVFWVMIKSQQITLPHQTAAMLLPIVAPIVVSATGAVVAKNLSDPNHALITVVACLALWGIGVPTAMLVLAMYFHRLMLHKLPSSDIIVSVFLPLGPLGQGGYGIMTMGMVARDVFPTKHTIHPLAGDVFYILAFFIAIILWGFGLVWLCFAALSTLSTWKFPFNMSWWSLTFPLGVFAQSTLTLGYELPSMTFKVLGAIFAVAVVVFWALVSALTIYHAIYTSGEIFAAPHLMGVGVIGRGFKKNEDTESA